MSDNQAIGGTGASPSDPQPTFFPPSGAAFGGGIAADDESSVSVEKTTFADDLAKSGDSPNPSTPDSYGSAGNASGGAIDFESSGSLVLNQSQLRDNLAIGGSAQSPGQAFGGGVCVAYADSVTVSDSLLRGNEAETGTGFVHLAPGVEPYFTDYAVASGGGIYVGYEQGTLSLIDSRVITNRAVGRDNGVASGGGLAMNDGQTDLVNDTLKSNMAIGGSIVTNSSFGQAAGGAIAVNNATMTVTDSTFLDNQATTATVSQDFAQTGSNDASLGGAIENTGASIQIFGGSFIGNRASGGAGVAGSPGAAGEGGAIFSAGSLGFSGVVDPLQVLPTASMSVAGVKFLKNLAIGGPGAPQSSSVARAGGTGQGGAIDNEKFSSLDLSSSTVPANQAIATGDGQGLGGGLYLAQLSTNTFEPDTIVDNRATTSGNNVDDLSQ
jgi:hypothetical protein